METWAGYLISLHVSVPSCRTWGDGSTGYFIQAQGVIRYDTYRPWHVETSLGTRIVDWNSSREENML